MRSNTTCTLSIYGHGLLARVICTPPHDTEDGLCSMEGFYEASKA